MYTFSSRFRGIVFVPICELSWVSFYVFYCPCDRYINSNVSFCSVTKMNLAHSVVSSMIIFVPLISQLIF